MLREEDLHSKLQNSLQFTFTWRIVKDPWTQGPGRQAQSTSSVTSRTGVYI